MRQSRAICTDRGTGRTLPPTSNGPLDSSYGDSNYDGPHCSRNVCVYPGRTTRSIMALAGRRKDAAHMYRHLLRAIQAATHQHPDRSATITRLYKSHFRTQQPWVPTTPPLIAQAWRTTILFLASAAHSPRAKVAEMDVWRQKARQILTTRANAIVARGMSNSQLATAEDQRAALAAALAQHARLATQQEIKQLKHRAYRRATAQAMARPALRSEPERIETQVSDIHSTPEMKRVFELEEQVAQLTKAAETVTPQERSRAVRLAHARLGSSDPLPNDSELGLATLPPQLQAKIQAELDPWATATELEPPPVPGQDTLASQILHSLAFLTFRYLSPTTLLSHRKSGGTDPTRVPTIRAVHLESLKEIQTAVSGDQKSKSEENDDLSAWLNEETGVDEAIRITLPSLLVPPRLVPGPPKDTRGHATIRAPRPNKFWDGQKMRAPSARNTSDTLARDLIRVRAVLRTMHLRAWRLRELKHIDRVRTALDRGETHSPLGYQWDLWSGALPSEGPFADLKIMDWTPEQDHRERQALFAEVLDLPDHKLTQLRDTASKDFQAVKRVFRGMKSEYEARSFVTAAEQMPHSAIASLVRDAERDVGVVLGSERFGQVLRNEWVES